MLLFCCYLYSVGGMRDPFPFSPADFVSPALQHGRSPGFPPLGILCSQRYKSPAALWGSRQTVTRRM